MPKKAVMPTKGTLSLRGFSDVSAQRAGYALRHERLDGCLSSAAIQICRFRAISRQRQSLLSVGAGGEDRDGEVYMEPVNVGDVIEFTLPDLISVGLVEAEEEVCVSQRCLAF